MFFGDQLPVRLPALKFLQFSLRYVQVELIHLNNKNEQNQNNSYQFTSKIAGRNWQADKPPPSQLMVIVSDSQRPRASLYMLSANIIKQIMNQSEPMLSANSEQPTLQKMEIELPPLQPGSLARAEELLDSESCKRQSQNLPVRKEIASNGPGVSEVKMIVESNESHYRTRRGFRKNDYNPTEKKKESQQEIAAYREEKYEPQPRYQLIKKEQDRQSDVFLKIVEYLKKIEWDKPTSIHKMNPFQYLTPSCFWFWVCAEYFSLNMGSKKTNAQAVAEIIHKVNKIRYLIPTRLGKMMHFHQIQGRFLEFQTPKLNRACRPIVQTLSACIPPSSYNTFGHNHEMGERNLQMTEVSEDNLWRSTLRATVFNYVKKNCSGHIQSLLEEGVENLNSIQNEMVAPLIEEQRAIQPIENGEMIVEQEVPQTQNKQINQKTKKQNQSRIKHKDTILSTVSIPQENRVFDQNDLLLDTVLHLPIDKIISILQSQIQQVKYPRVQQNLIPIPADPFQLISPTHPEQGQFLEYLKRKKQMDQHANQNIQQPKLPNSDDNIVEDVKCQVCTDGDYTDDNLIVFCATCNISVHQRCVGLAKVPAESWICQVCHAFGPQGRFLRCPMCSVKGGALKRTTISSDTQIFKENNPSYHEYLRKCPVTKIKEEYPIPPRQQGGDMKLFYDYYDPVPTTQADEPLCSFVWMHFTCSIWVPECYFEERAGVINIKGVQTVDKKRFRLMCETCHTSKTGAAIKCADQDCFVHYHAECARISGVYMEQRHVDTLKYYIYCRTHQPLKLTRVRQAKSKKSKDQIVKFCRGIEKYIETYRLATVPFKLLKNNKKIKMKKELKGKEVREVKENDHVEFMEKLKDFMVSGRKLVVCLKKVGDKAFKVIDIQQPVKRTLKSNINKNDQIWQCFTYRNLSSIQLFKKYKRIMKEMVDIKDKFCKDIKSETKISKKRDRKKARQYEEAHAQQDPDQLYCVCREKYVAGDLMMQCQICEEWYHFKCIGFTGTEDDASKVLFNCPQCEEFQNQDEIEERRFKYQDYYLPGFQIQYVKEDDNEDENEEEQKESESEDGNEDEEENEVISEQNKQYSHSMELEEEPQRRSDLSKQKSNQSGGGESGNNILGSRQDIDQVERGKCNAVVPFVEFAPAKQDQQEIPEHQLSKENVPMPAVQIIDKQNSGENYQAMEVEQKQMNS